MNLDRLKYILLAVGVVAGAAVYLTSNPARLSGQIEEVRTLKVEEQASVALVNFEAQNVTTNDFVAYDRILQLVDSGGQTRTGKLVSGPDLNDLFKYFPELGGMKDEPFLAQRSIAAGETIRGLVAARFEVPESELINRQDMVLRLVDGAGRPTDIHEKPEN